MKTKAVSLKLPPVKVNCCSRSQRWQHLNSTSAVGCDLSELTLRGLYALARLKCRNNWWAPASVRRMSGQMVPLPWHGRVQVRGRGIETATTILFVHARLWRVAHPFVELNVLHVVVLFLLITKTNGIFLLRKITQTINRERHSKMPTDYMDNLLYTWISSFFTHWFLWLWRKRRNNQICDGFKFQTHTHPVGFVDF